jgi:hypothetical protein
VIKDSLASGNAGPGCTLADFTAGGIIAPPASWSGFES